MIHAYDTELSPVWESSSSDEDSQFPVEVQMTAL